jgi:hypothetical protein
MSRISHKYKFVFFSFPKTGSESVRSVLDPYSDIIAVTKSEITKENPFYSHITPKETQKIFEQKGWKYNEYYKFTCVRNPYERLMSLYKMKYKLFNMKAFSDWVVTLKPNSRERGDWYKNGIISFKNFISNSHGDILVDDVIKLEEIDIKLPQVLNKLGLNINSIPHINKGNVNEKKLVKKALKNNFINEKSKDFIMKNYEWEMKEYGYNF